MKFCYGCGHTTGGEPLFCNFCGRSYDAKLCPKLHPNARIAEACSRCGSRDLSLPHPKIPFLWRLLAWLAQALSGVVLVFLSIPVALRAVRALASYSQVYQPLVIAVLIASWWFLWLLLPILLRRMIYSALTRRNDGR
jgi:succinate dehydrogenase hydrophobic anchor subunit